MPFNSFLNDKRSKRSERYQPEEAVSSDDAMPPQKVPCGMGSAIGNMKLDLFIEQIDQYAEDIKDDDKRATQWQTHLEGLRALIEKTRNGLEGQEQLREENTSLMEQVASLTIDVEQGQSALSSLKQKYDAQCDRLKETRAGLQRSHVDVATLSQKVEFLSGQVIALKSELIEKSTFLENERVTNTKLGVAQSQIAGDLKSEQTVTAELRAEAKAASDTIAELQALLKADVEYRETMQNELAASAKHVDRLQGELADLNSRLDVSREDLAGYKAISQEEIALREKKLAVLEAQIQSLEADKAALRQTITHSSSEADRAMDEFQSERHAHKATKAALVAVEKELSAAKAANLRELTKVTKRDHRIADLQTQRKSDAAAMKTAKAEQRAVLKENKHLAKQVARLQAELSKRERKDAKAPANGTEKQSSRTKRVRAVITKT